ncbi:MAG: hypothetical protein JW784_05490 [Candidatus Cloacimonetes bacterium]|nr:hypothetical protein [Candidatus Cloacimonadota bacterium]
MGKVVIIGLVIIGALVAITMVSVQDKSEKIPDTETDQALELEVIRIGNYALKYALQELRNKNIPINQGYYMQHFDSFPVLSGGIDSISYNPVTIDTIFISAFVNCEISGKSTTHESRAVVKYNPLSVTPSGVTNAITSDGLVKITGSAEVNGEVEEQATFDFEEIFGYTKEQIRNAATHLYIDPANNQLPVDNVTWMETDVNNKVVISSNTWSGSGILVVDGDLDLSGGYFAGIIWVMGDCVMGTGNPTVEGALFIEGESDVDLTKIAGNPIINFNSDEVNKTYALSLGGSQYQLIGWYE